MLDLSEIVMRLAAAMLIGSTIGLNRNLKGKAVGIRTLGLVALGAALLVMASDDFGVGGHTDATSRVMQGIITGIGFIGAGVILHDPKGSGGGGGVHGLTTAAAVWVTACMGIVCGLGAWRVALVALCFITFLLMFGGKIEKRCHKLLGHDKPSNDQQEYKAEE